MTICPQCFGRASSLAASNPCAHRSRQRSVQLLCTYTSQCHRNTNSCMVLSILFEIVCLLEMPSMYLYMLAIPSSAFEFIFQWHASLLRHLWRLICSWCYSRNFHDWQVNQHLLPTRYSPLNTLYLCLIENQSLTVL